MTPNPRLFDSHDPCTSRSPVMRDGIPWQVLKSMSKEDFNAYWSKGGTQPFTVDVNTLKSTKPKEEEHGNDCYKGA